MGGTCFATERTRSTTCIASSAHHLRAYVRLTYPSPVNVQLIYRSWYTAMHKLYAPVALARLLPNQSAVLSVVLWFCEVHSPQSQSCWPQI